jgi:hypothetical protein
MRTITVTNFNELNEAFSKYKNDRAWIFRGHSNFEWKLVPKIGRPEFENIDERACFKSWKRRAIEFVDSTDLNDWDWLSIAQHHGLATRLMDWTYNPLNAAYFSVKEKYDVDAVIYCHRPTYIAITNNNRPFNVPLTGSFRPRGVTRRIISQSGIFTIHHKPRIPMDEIDANYELEQIVIDKTYRDKLLIKLDHYGVNEYSLFPNLDSLSSYVNWFTSHSEKLF